MWGVVPQRILDFLGLVSDSILGSVGGISTSRSDGPTISDSGTSRTNPLNFITMMAQTLSDLVYLQFIMRRMHANYKCQTTSVPS